MKIEHYLALLAFCSIALAALAAALATADFGTGQLEMELSVGGNQSAAGTIAIDSVELSPDENSAAAGLQLNPVAKGSKTLSVAATVSAENAGELADIVVTASLANSTMTIITPITLEKTVEIDSSTAVYEGGFNVNFTLLAGNYTVEISAASGSGQPAATANASADFEWLSLAAFELDSSSIKLNAQPGNRTAIEGDSDFSTRDKPTVRNIGNTVINLAFASQGFTGTENDTLNAKISSANIKASLELIPTFNSTLAKTLSNSSRTIEAELQPGEARALSFSVYAPKTSKLGDYTGNITIAALVVS